MLIEQDYFSASTWTVKRRLYYEPPVRQTVLFMQIKSHTKTSLASKGRKQSLCLQAVNVLPFTLGT